MVTPFNASILADVNYTVVNAAYQGNLAGKTDATVIAQYCSFFNNIAGWWILLALALLIIDLPVQAFLKKHHPRFALWHNRVSSTVHIGFLAFLLQILIKGWWT